MLPLIPTVSKGSGLSEIMGRAAAPQPVLSVPGRNLEDSIFLDVRWRKCVLSQEKLRSSLCRQTVLDDSSLKTDIDGIHLTHT